MWHKRRYNTMQHIEQVCNNLVDLLKLVQNVQIKKYLFIETVHIRTCSIVAAVAALYFIRKSK